MRAPLHALHRSPVLVSHDLPISVARQHLLAARDARGVVVTGEPGGPRVVMAETLLREPADSTRLLGAVMCCPADVLPSATEVRAAVAAAVGRPDGHTDHSLLIRLEDGDGADHLGLIAPGDLLVELAWKLDLGQQVDTLTGLTGRGEVVHAVQMGLSDLGGPMVAVAFLDLDGFKHVNDRYGHSVGDRVLQAIARRLQNGLQAGDVLARMGGDQFAAVLRVSDVAEARRAGHRLLERARLPVDQGVAQVSVDLSIGIALGTPGVEPSERPDRLLGDADALMYLAKQHGGGLLVADDHADPVVTRSQLAQALGADELVLHYQPIIPLDGTSFSAVEALVRWPRPDGTTLSPDAFVPLAEATGQIVELDWWAVRRALAQLLAWDELTGDHAPMTVHVNLSARTLADGGLIGHVGTLLADTGVHPSRLTLEVTETAMIADVERAATVLTSLRSLGVHTVIDDFGVGQSSLAQLTQLPVSGLKIDRSFVTRLAERAIDRGVVRLVRTLADELGLDVVAEGVESAEQAAVLTQLGVTHAQGWLWSPALEGAAVRDGERAAILDAARPARPHLGRAPAPG